MRRETAEPTIRPMTAADGAGLYALLSDPRVMRYLEGPYDRPRAEAFLQKAGLSDPPLIYAAEARGAFVGYVIYHAYDASSVEIGWVLRREHWGRGYASALTGQLLSRAGREKKSVVLECLPAQGATRRIAEKFGFLPWGQNGALDVYRLEWKDGE